MSSTPPPNVVLVDWPALVVDAVDDLIDDRHRQILLRRFGLVHGPRTLRALGQELGISREWVRQLEDKALGRIHARAKRPGTSAHALAAAFHQLPHVGDHALVAAIVNTASTQFDCASTWLVKALSRMVGHPPERTCELADLSEQYLIYRRKRIRENHHQQQRQAAIEDRLAKWIRDAAWPDSAHAALAIDTHRKRTPRTDNHVGQSGSFHSEKLGRTVQFESLLEEAALMTAENSAHVRSYHEQPCVIPYSGLDSDCTAYIPDLLITLTDGRRLLIEVKPLWQLAVTDNRLKAQAAQHFAHHHGWGWVTIADAGRTYQDLLHRPINPDAHHALTVALTAGPIDWPQMRQLCQRTPIAALDVAAYAAQHNVALTLNPYRLGP